MIYNRALDTGQGGRHTASRTGVLIIELREQEMRQPQTAGPYVYVVQDTDLNLNRARVYGELVPILPMGRNITMSPQPVLRELRRKLKKFTDEDFLLLVGDPIIIALAIYVAAEINRGCVQVLKYDRDLRDYYIVRIDLHDKPVVGEE